MNKKRIDEFVSQIESEIMTESENALIFGGNDGLFGGKKETNNCGCTNVSPCNSTITNNCTCKNIEESPSPQPGPNIPGHTTIVVKEP